MRRMLSHVLSWLSHPSSLALLAIVGGGAIVVLANTAYQTASEREKKAELAEEANSILEPELQSNKALLDKSRWLVAHSGVSFDDFSVSSWETISKGGLLLGLKSDRTRKLLKVYSLIYKANNLQAGLREAAMRGVTSNVTVTPQTASHEYRSMLGAALDNLDTAFRDLGMRAPSDQPHRPPDAAVGAP